MKKQYDGVDYAAMAAISLTVTVILFGSILVINGPKKEAVEAPAPTTEAVEEETSATEATEAIAATEATAPVEVAVIVKEKAAAKLGNKAIKKAEEPQSTPMPIATPTPTPTPAPAPIPDPSSVPPAPEPPTPVPEPPRPAPPRPAYNY